MPRRKRKKSMQPLAALMRRHVRTLSGLLLCCVLAALAMAGKQWLSDPYRFPLNVVKFEGEFRHLDRSDLQAAIMMHTVGGFFTVDVDAMREAAEQLPWVYKANVQRVWPDTIRVVVDEQQPVALWGDLGLLNRFGEVFVPQNRDGLAGLPGMSGPDGHERRVFEIYQQMSMMLAPLGMLVRRVDLDERRAIDVEVDGGMQLALGRSDTLLRLQRFVRAWPDIAAGTAQAGRVDLRYSNGFSVFLQQAGAGHQTGKQG